MRLIYEHLEPLSCDRLRKIKTYLYDRIIVINHLIEKKERPNLLKFEEFEGTFGPSKRDEF